MTCYAVSDYLYDDGYYTDEEALVPCTLPPANSPNQKTVVLDLDNTLICPLIDPSSIHGSYDFVVECDDDDDYDDYYFDDDDDTEDDDDDDDIYYVKKRPYVDEFLKYLSEKNFEIVVFTAAKEAYASRVLDILDPNNLISHRFYQDSCRSVDGWYVKDLSGLGRDLKNVVIIDDRPTSYLLQPENGIPIKPFTDDPEDHELKKLMDEFFDKCEQYEDLKDALKHYMGVKNSKQEREIEDEVLKVSKLVERLL